MLIEAELLGPVDQLQRRRGAEARRERAVVIHQRSVSAEDQDTVVIKRLSAGTTALGQLYTDARRKVRLPSVTLSLIQVVGVDLSTL